MIYLVRQIWRYKRRQHFKAQVVSRLPHLVQRHVVIGRHEKFFIRIAKNALKIDVDVNVTAIAPYRKREYDKEKEKEKRLYLTYPIADH